MRIWWQSFLDPGASGPYLAALADHLAGLAAPGTAVEVQGLSPPDRGFSRLAEFRCAVLAVDNGIAAAEAGFDAVVVGHFQDPGLYELKSAVPIPVVGAGEATLHLAAQLGRSIGLVTLDLVFRGLHLEQAERYGLGGRIAGVTALNATPAAFAAAFGGDAAARSTLLDAFRAAAAPLVAAGADVIVPAGVLPGLLIGGEPGLRIGHAPVVNCAAVALMQAEMQVRLARATGLGVARGPFCAAAPAEAVADFRDLVARGRGG